MTRFKIIDLISTVITRTEGKLGSDVRCVTELWKIEVES